MSKHDDEYAQALGLLDRMHTAGRVSDVEYEVKRARLLEEASSTSPTAGRYLVRLAVVVAVLAVLLGLLGWIVSATS